MRYYTKEQLVIGLKALISQNDEHARRALLSIYEYQTKQEKSTQETIEDNGVGFNGQDANFCSGVAEQYLNQNFISVKQYKKLKRIMPKYAGQLISHSISQGKIKCKCRGKYYW